MASSCPTLRGARRVFLLAGAFRHLRFRELRGTESRNLADKTLFDMLTVYLAGPEVFLPDAIEIGRQKKLICAQYGFEGLYPLDNETSAKTGERADRLIYQANKAMMERVDFGICNLTPFRGPGADAGTVFELGLMVGLRKRVFAYTNDASDYASRVARGLPGDLPDRQRDQSDMTIEDFGNFDNLMLEWAVRESSGHPIVRHGANNADLYRDLAGFEECLRLAAADIAGT